MNNRICWVLLFALWSAAPVVRAQQMTYTLPPLAWSAINTNTALYRLHLDRLAQTTGSGPSHRATDDAPSVSPRRGASTAPPAASIRSNATKDLAAAYPPAAQSRAEAVFRDLLRQYGQLERQFGIPPRDLGGAVAALLAGSYMAYRGVAFPDEHFKPLVAQMQAMVANNPEFASVPDADRQYTYDQLATLGMFLATTQMALQQRPNEALRAQMRLAAKGYLEQLLKTDAQRVQITASGLFLK